MVVLPVIPAILEAEAGELPKVQGLLGIHSQPGLVRPCLYKKKKKKKKVGQQ
jgi:hypothetical protein